MCLVRLGQPCQGTWVKIREDWEGRQNVCTLPEGIVFFLSSFPESVIGSWC